MVDKGTLHALTVREYVQQLDGSFGKLSPKAVEGRFHRYEKAQPEICALFRAVQRLFATDDFPEEALFYAIAVQGFLTEVLRKEPTPAEVIDVLQTAETADGLFARAAAAVAPPHDPATVVFPRGSALAEFCGLWEEYLGELVEGGVIEARLVAALRKWFAVVLLLGDEAVGGVSRPLEETEESEA